MTSASSDTGRWQKQHAPLPTGINVVSTAGLLWCQLPNSKLKVASPNSDPHRSLTPDKSECSPSALSLKFNSAHGSSDNPDKGRSLYCSTSYSQVNNGFQCLYFSILHLDWCCRWLPPAMTLAGGHHQTAAQRGGEAKEKDKPLAGLQRDK